MKVGNKEINDECQYCGEMLTCELFREGHGIARARTNVASMVGCQIEHMRKRENEQAM